MLLSKKLLFYQNLFPKEFYVPGHYQTYLIPGVYYVITRSAGGAGGENGANASWSGGPGGAGGYGEITSQIITVKDFTVADVYVGAGGKLRANSGNGGAGGSPAGSGGSGGNGGGGGEPSYVVINSYLVSAEAGGGGGGGGGCAGGPGRRAGGGAGGGGGGYYKLGTPTLNTLRAVTIYFYTYLENNQFMWNFSTEPGESNTTYVEIPANEELYVGKSFSRTQTATDTITVTSVITATVKEIKSNGNVVFDCSYYDDLIFISEQKKDLEVENLVTVQGSFAILSVAGKTGGTGASYYQYGGAGQNGRTTDGGNLIKAGRGGGGNHYQTGEGGAGGTGFGASGGGGNAGDRDEHTHEDSKGGFGGGGAGGSITAAGGGVTVQSWGTVATAGSNHFTTPVDTTAENAEYGITGNYGTGGTIATAGQGGCVIIRLVNTATEFIDLGDIITTVPSSIDDAGTITGETEESDDAGSITGTVESSDDAGKIYTETEATQWVLGLITETVSETTNCGNIM